MENTGNDADQPLGLGAKLLRGWSRSCPNCGTDRLFQGYLKVTPACGHCHAKLGEIRADDFPPYVTMFIVGHIIVPLILAAEKVYAPEIWVHLAIWPAAAVVLTGLLMPRVKGAIFGLMWHLRLKGDEFQ